MTFAEFQKMVAAGSVPAVVLFHGEEPFLARLGVELLKRRLIAPGSEAFDFVTMTGRDASAEAIAAQSATSPMLSERRLTVLYEFDALSASQRAKFLSLLGRPASAASCLALVSFERLSTGTKFEREVQAKAAVVECGRVAGDALAALVSRMARERGREIDASAVAALVDATDGSLGRIANELDKLACFVPEGETLTAAHVDEAVGARASGVAELATAVAERDLGRALAVLDGLVEGGTEPAWIVTQLWNHWLSLWGARVAKGGRFSPTGWSRAWEGVRNVTDLAARRTSKEYAQGVRAFRRADEDIRRGAAPRPTVSLLVREIVRARATGA